jgi:hypothetical protein
LKSEINLNNILKSVPTSQKTHYVSITMTSQLMLFRKITTVYCKNQTKHINTVYEQNEGEFVRFK